MKISDLKTVAKLMIKYYTIQNVKEFQMRYCASMWLILLQNCRRLKLKGRKNCLYKYIKNVSPYIRHFFRTFKDDFSLLNSF